METAAYDGGTTAQCGFHENCFDGSDVVQSLSIAAIEITQYLCTKRNHWLLL